MFMFVMTVCGFLSAVADLEKFRRQGSQATAYVVYVKPQLTQYAEICRRSDQFARPALSIPSVKYF